MGQMQTEQVIGIIETIQSTQEPEPTNYGWLLLLAMIPIIPAMIKLYMNRKK